MKRLNTLQLIYHLLKGRGASLAFEGLILAGIAVGLALSFKIGFAVVAAAFLTNEMRGMVNGYRIGKRISKAAKEGEIVCMEHGGARILPGKWPSNTRIVPFVGGPVTHRLIEARDAETILGVLGGIVHADSCYQGGLLPPEYLADVKRIAEMLRIEHGDGIQLHEHDCEAP